LNYNFLGANDLRDLGFLLNLASCEILAPEHISPDLLMILVTVSNVGQYIKMLDALYNEAAMCIEEKNRSIWMMKTNKQKMIPKDLEWGSTGPRGGYVMPQWSDTTATAFFHMDWRRLKEGE
jgi:hypothetical protein